MRKVLNCTKCWKFEIRAEIRNWFWKVILEMRTKLLNSTKSDIKARNRVDNLKFGLESLLVQEG